MRIVHLSDIHLNKGHLKDFQDLAREALIGDLIMENTKKKIDLIFITGDLIDKGGESFGKIEDAFKFFEENVINPIKSELGMDNNKFYFAPGNHDAFRDADSQITEKGLKQHLVATAEVNKFIDSNSLEGIKRILPYKEFEKNFYTDNFIKKDITNFQSSYIIEIDGKTIGINCLNTAWRCYDSKTDNERIILGERQLVEGNKVIRECDIKIALVHHHIDWLQKFDRESIESFIPKFYDAVFFGHVHKGSSWTTTKSYGDIFVSVAPINSAENVRSNDTVYSNGYSIIDYDIDLGKVFVHYRKYRQKSISYVTNTDLGDDGKDEFDISKNLAVKKKSLGESDNLIKQETKVINSEREDTVYLDKSSMTDELMVEKKVFSVGFIKHKHLISKIVEMVSQYSIRYQDLMKDLELVTILIDKLILKLSLVGYDNEYIRTLIHLDEYFIKLGSNSEDSIKALDQLYNSICWFWDKVADDIITGIFQGEITIPSIVEQIINLEGEGCTKDQYIKVLIEAKQTYIAMYSGNDYEVKKNSDISLQCQVMLCVILPTYLNRKKIVNWSSELQIGEFEDIEAEELLKGIKDEYLKLRSRFVERNISIESIYSKVRDNKLTIIKGKSGSGKSSIISKIIEKLSIENYGNTFSSAVIIYSFINSKNIHDLVKSIVIQCNSRLVNKIDTRILNEIQPEYNLWTNDQANLNKNMFNNIYDIYQRIIKEVVNNFIIEHGEIYIFIDSLEIVNIYENEIENLFVGLPNNSHIIICTGENNEGISDLVANKFIKKVIIEISYLNLEEIASMLDLHYGEEENILVVDEIYKRTQGNIKMIKNLIVKSNEGNIDILTFLKSDTAEYDIENAKLFNKMANKWILFSTEILEETLLILSIFEYIDFISFDKLQSFLNYKGYDVRLPKIKKFLSKVDNQLIYTTNNKVKILNKDFAVFVVNKFFSKTDVEKFVTDLFNWICKCRKKSYYFTVEFLKYLRKKKLIDEVTFNANLNRFIEQKKKDSEGQDLFNIGSLMLGKNKDMIEYSLKMIEVAIELNNADAKGYLGVLLIQGRYIEQDVNRGEALLNEACELGNTIAKSMLGEILLIGDLIAGDNEKGRKLLFEASEEGDIEAKLNLAFRLITGRGMKPNPIQGREFLCDLIRENNTRAMVLMGKFMIDGVSMKIDIDEGLRLINKAIRLGSLKAKLELARRLINGAGIKADKTEGMKLLHELVDLGNVEAKRGLAKASIIEGDIKKGCQLFEELINDNDWNSISVYSRLALDGKLPEKDKQRAIELLKKEVENKNIDAMRELGIIFIEGIGIERNTELGIGLLEDAISKSDVASMRELGYKYANGINVAQNKQRGEVLLLAAVERGDISSKCLYGLTLIDNYNDQDSKSKGIKLLEEAVSYGNIFAKLNLSNILFESKLNKKNIERSIQLLEECIVAGDCQAKRILGYRLFDGIGVPKDINRAKELLINAIDSNDALAKVILGEAIILRYIEEFTIDYGIELLEQAAQKENMAKKTLGTLLIEGTNIMQDKAKGEALLRCAADSGDMLAMRALYDMLLDGRYLERNVDEGKKYLMKAIGCNDDTAIVNFAERLLDGVGLPKDKFKGESIFNKLVINNNSDAMCEYGQRLILGDGVTTDKSKGEKLLSEAIQLGNITAKRYLALNIINGSVETHSKDYAIQLLDENVLESDIMTIILYGEMLIDGDKIQEDVGRGIKLLDECSKINKTVGRYHFGKRLIEGKNVTQEIERGLSLLEDAASKGNERAKLYLSNIYIFGRYVDKDVDKGMEFLNYLVLNGNEDAKEKLAFMLIKGDGIKRDKEKGIYLINELVERENSDVMHRYGEMLIDGFYVDKDVKQGQELLNRAAKSENYYAAYIMGKRLLDGNGVKKHKSHGMKEFDKAIRHGINSAIFEYGIRLKYGIDISKNEVDGDRKMKSVLGNAKIGDKYSLGVIAYKFKEYELATKLFYEEYNNKGQEAAISLAYMLRRNEIRGNINLPDIPTLLEKPLKSKNHRAYINLALHYIRKNEENQYWEKVDEIFKSLGYCGDAAGWWLETSMQGDLEGELVIGLLDRYGLIPGISKISFVDRFKKVNKNGWNIPSWMLEDITTYDEVAVTK